MMKYKPVFCFKCYLNIFEIVTIIYHEIVDLHYFNIMKLADNQL